MKIILKYETGIRLYAFLENDQLKLKKTCQALYQKISFLFKKSVGKLQLSLLLLLPGLFSSVTIGTVTNRDPE